MRSVRSRFFLASFLLVLASFSDFAFATEEKPWTEQFLSEFDGIKMQLSGVEKTQRDISVQKDKILRELDRIRVWVRHSGG